MHVHTKNISHEPIGYNTKIDTEGIAGAREIFRFYTICDLPRENRPSSHLVMIVEIPILKILIGLTSFCSC